MHSLVPEIALLTLIGIVLISKLLNDKLKVPMPYSLLILSYLIYQINPSMLGVSFGENFDAYLLFTIPIILMKDAYHLKLSDIKYYGWSIFYLAVICIALSIIIGATMFYFNLFPGLTIGMYVALFAINMATDAISVENIMSQFKSIPHKIKVLVEGESLGNDATAMIAFYFVGLPWIINDTFDFSTLPGTVSYVFLTSIVIGLGTGIIGFYVLKMFKEARYETLILIGIAYASFIIGESFHISGILALIVSIVTVKGLIDKELQEEKKDIHISSTNYKGLMNILKKESTNKENQKTIIATLSEYAYIAVVIVFFSLADIINIDLIIKYWNEILIMFGVTTIIRGIVMAKFWFLSNKIKVFEPINSSAWFILTMAGIKGALSIVMIHSLPKDFVWLERFEAITVGVIILSIFIYGCSLFLYFILTNKKTLNKKGLI